MDTKAELRAVKEALCHGRDLLLSVDGACIDMALKLELSDLTLSDMIALADIFWIGETKDGSPRISSPTSNGMAPC